MAQLNWKPSYDGSALRWRPSYLPEELPEAPSGTVTIGAITPTSSGASVAITYDGGDATGFEYRIDGGSAVSGGSASPIVVSGLSASTEYDLEIRPTNDGGEGAWSAVATFETRMANPGDRAVMVRKISIVDPEDPVETFEFDEGSVDDPIQIEQGGTFDLSQYIAGGATPYKPLTIKTGELPAGVTLDPETWVLSASAEATPVLSDDVTFEALDAEEEDEEPGGGDPGGEDPDPDPDPPEPGDLPTFGITSAVGGSDLPFAFGHVFAKGDVPSGHYVDSDLTDWQAVPTTYWPDGSVRHAIIAGRATCTASVLKSITLSTSETDRSGTDLTESDLASALAGMGTTNVVAGAETITLADLVGTGAKHRTVCAGPVMSNWLYRKQLTGSNHVVVWFDVRLFKGGAVEVFPWVENGYLTVASPTNDERAYTVNVNGSQVFSGTIDIKHHTRVPLLDNAASGFKHWSYWSADPQIEPAHDTAYLRATRMVPNYGWTEPSSGTLNGIQQTYAPNTLAGINPSMGVAGTSAAILNLPDALYAATGDPRAWRASMAFGLSGGSWSIHHRAEAASTQGANGNPNEPFMFSEYPSASIQIQDSPTIPTGTGGTNGSPVVSHQPPYGYLQWLCSGRWWFLEEMVFWSGWNYLYQTVANRTPPGGNGAGGVLRTTAGANTDRGAAWGLRTLAQGLVSVPSDHPCYASLKASWEANTSWFKAYAIDGTVSGGAGVNALGVLGFYGSFAQSVYGTGNSNTEMYGAGWMQAMIGGVLGFTWDLELPQDSASEDRHEAIRDHAYTLVVARTGDGSGDSWNYRNFIVYGLNWGEIGGTYYPSWDGAYAIYKAGCGITDDDDGGTSLFAHSSDTVLAPGSSSLPYFGQALTALVYAVDHGKAGAAEGHARVTGASNFDSYAAAEFHDDPVYAIVPRAA